VAALKFNIHRRQNAMLTDVFGKFCQLDFVELAAWIGF